jgi:hypothetical protein
MNNTIFETAINGDYKYKGETFDIFINERTLDTSGDIVSCHSLPALLKNYRHSY